MVYSSTRIKDITSVEYVRENQLIGCGIVVGLNGSGDSFKASPATRESLIGMLERIGVNIRNLDMDPKNIAIVMVTASLPPFSTKGKSIDVHVASFGNAKSLFGGVLLPTPLMGADGKVYAVSGGPVVVNGYDIGQNNQQSFKGVPTSGKIPNGAIVEKEIDFEFENGRAIKLSLSYPDFTTATRIANVINMSNGQKKIAKVLNPACIGIVIPNGYTKSRFLSKIEQLHITPDEDARIVFDEKSGVLVINDKIRISPVAISHGSITVRVSTVEAVSNSNVMAQGQKYSNTKMLVNEGGKGNFVLMDGGATLHDLVVALNALGCNTNDMIAILQAVKHSGALRGKVNNI